MIKKNKTKMKISVTARFVCVLICALTLLSISVLSFASCGSKRFAADSLYIRVDGDKKVISAEIPIGEDVDKDNVYLFALDVWQSEADLGSIAPLAKAKVTPLTAPAMKVIEKLAILLRQKADYGLRLKAAYDAGDKAALAELRAESREIAALLEDARKAHRDSWFFYNKPYGWEVHDLRYGALIARFDTVEERLRAYLNGEVESLDELAAERLLFREPIDGQYLRYDWDRFSAVFTPSII